MNLYKKDKKMPIIKKIFWIPFTAILIGIIGIAYLSSVTLKEGLLGEMRSNGIQAAEYMIDRIEDNEEAINIINTLLEKEIIITGNAVIANKDDLSSERLKQIASQLGASEINWYTNTAEILYSNIDRYVGLQIPIGHKVYEYYKSGEEIFVEPEIRKDTESNNYGKYGYVRASTGEFVQVIIDSQDIVKLTERFDYQSLVESIAGNSGILYALYVDEDLKNIAQSHESLKNLDLTDDIGVKSAILRGNSYSQEYFSKEDNIMIYDVIVPIMSNGKVLGALKLAYSMENVRRAVQKSRLVIYVLGFTFLGIVTFILQQLQKKQIINPILALNNDIGSISLEENLKYRLPINDKDSFAQLRKTTNTLLEKLELYFLSMIENQEELLASNEELEATLGQLSANEQQLISQYDKIKNQKEYIQFLADYDPLTQLQNRRRFAETLEDNLKEGISGAILLLDIDNFKNINDTLGHLYGDQVLEYVAKLLKSVSCNDVTAYRFGGDEFLINIQGEDLSPSSPCINRILDAFMQNHVIEGVENYVGVSTGIVRYPLDGDTVEALLIKADIAMYQAKRAGKNQAIFFGEQMTSSFTRRVEMENMLRKTTEKQDFLLLYQPIINSSTGEIAYFEALIRINGVGISPAVFIPIAEETQLIIPIGQWVIKEAIGQLRKWIDLGYDPKPIAINLSPIQIHDITLVDFLVSQLEKHNIPASLIEVEVTENLLLENRQQNITTLEKIQALGIDISLDDFGTGYSSFNYLTYIPITKIKLDKSLKDKFVYHENGQVMDSLISLIHSFKLEVVIEGVEEVNEFAKLKQSGSDYLQGYLFSKPLPAKEVEEIFENSYLPLLANNGAN